MFSVSRRSQARPKGGGGGVRWVQSLVISHLLGKKTQVMKPVSKVVCGCFISGEAVVSCPDFFTPRLPSLNSLQAFEGEGGGGGGVSYSNFEAASIFFNIIYTGWPTKNAILTINNFKKTRNRMKKKCTLLR